MRVSLCMTTKNNETFFDGWHDLNTKPGYVQYGPLPKGAEIVLASLPEKVEMGEFFSYGPYVLKLVGYDKEVDWWICKEKHSWFDSLKDKFRRTANIWIKNE